MAWVKIDQHFYDHPKWAEAPGDSIALWLAAMAWCNRNNSLDGFIPTAKLHGLVNIRNLAPPQPTSSNGPPSTPPSASHHRLPHPRLRRIPTARKGPGDRRQALRRRQREAVRWGQSRPGATVRRSGKCDGKRDDKPHGKTIARYRYRSPTVRTYSTPLTWVVCRRGEIRMTNEQATGLAKRIINTWRLTPPLAEWGDMLAQRDTATASATYIRVT